MLKAEYGAKTLDPILAEVVERLVRFYDPERIYLFGSRARGDHRESSDYDFMVIVSDEAPDELFRLTHNALSEMDIYHDHKVYRRNWFDKQLHLKASMPSIILSEGKLLYLKEGISAPSAAASDSGDLTINEAEPPEQDSVLVKNTVDWITRAKVDLRSAEWNLGQSDEHLPRALFDSQQSAEKIMKAFLTWHDQRLKKHHDLALLRQNCLRIDPSLAPDLADANLLTAWCIKGRYPTGDLPPTRQPATEGMEIARKCFQAINARLPEKIQQTLT